MIDNPSLLRTSLIENIENCNLVSLVGMKNVTLLPTMTKARLWGTLGVSNKPVGMLQPVHVESLRCRCLGSRLVGRHLVEHTRLPGRLGPQAVNVHVAKLTGCY